MTIIRETAAQTMTFGHLEIAFDSRVLRPRPWTEAMSVWAAELAQAGPSGPVLEVCTGAGHIGLLAVAAQRRRTVLVDLDEIACSFAASNAAAAGLSDVVEVRQGRMDEVLGDAERFALVIADPPWVPSDETGIFPEDPLTAIDGGPDGLGLARTCLEVIGRHLFDGGSSLLQLGTLAQIGRIDDHLGARPDLALELVDFREYAGRGVVARIDRR